MDMADIAAEVGIERVEVLHGHTTQETAYLQDDYPYGRLRCFRRVWLEHTKNGYRLVTQTSNPKHDQDWRNAPKKSTYTDWAVLVKLPDIEDRPDDYLTWMGFGIWGPDPALEVRMHVNGIYEQLTDEERKWFDRFVVLNQRGNSRSRTEWNTETIPALAAYYNEHGEFPELVDSRVCGKYMPERDYPAAKAAVLLGHGR